MNLVHVLGRHPSLGVAALSISILFLWLWERNRLTRGVGDRVRSLVPLLASISVLATLILIGARFVTVLGGYR